MTAFSHITSDDIEFIREAGAPASPRADLVRLTESGQVVFTVKGIEFYKHALFVHGVSRDLKSIETSADFYRLGLDIQMAHIHNTTAVLEQQLNCGDIALQERDFATAVVIGDIEQIAEASSRLGCAESAGLNVIPAGFGQKKNRS